MTRNACPRIALALGLLAMFVHAPGLAQEQGKLSAEEAQKIGVEAVVYGLPLLLMDATKRVSINVPGPQPNAHAPINQFGSMLEYPPASDHTIVRMNVDTLYSLPGSTCRRSRSCCRYRTLTVATT